MIRVSYHLNHYIGHFRPDYLPLFGYGDEPFYASAFSSFLACPVFWEAAAGVVSVALDPIGDLLVAPVVALVVMAAGVERPPGRREIRRSMSVIVKLRRKLQSVAVVKQPQLKLRAETRVFLLGRD